ncbi:glycoside hydrolase family 13 protein [Mucilaginibacter terrenus]|uniref:Glycoside hydrolase family 13 protein n=1 Tax=Mucilaginibacter terrenus TaxID=2482727 RepID=A0A3E2NYE0_9SPHI|nr:glycoside hydrolase family 13 protein [Mucilaginibacter terrenus]RFZ85959.1 glycoside hydrolase family 13 protein [Mucilaginibacter terrenus]
MFTSLSADFTSPQQEETPFDKAPEWSKSAIWYQIFPERFRKGMESNNPKPENINIPPVGQIAPEGWQVSSWGRDWYSQDAWEEGREFIDNTYYRRYGGDLQGILDKLDYLQDLGVTALYINPLNDAPSSHKYDARNYHHIDVNFGPDPEGDLGIIASEDPADPATWQWTAADRLFLELIKEVHARNMRIIMDYSWNHTGVMFWAWQDVLKNQSQSRYKDWYEIRSFDDPNTPHNEFAYTGWVGVPSLPEIRKVDVTTHRINGQPYEGNINEGAKQHIFAVTRRWLAPNGNTDEGIDGFRLDVADQIGLGFWRDFRREVRSIKIDAYLVGEVWWDEWPDKLMDPTPYTQGDVFDAVMFYQAYRPARYFFAHTDYPLDAQQFKDSLEYEWNRVPEDKRYAMMNVSSTHDTPRLLTDFYNTNKYKFHANPREEPNYRTGRPDEETYKRLRLYLVHLFTTIGAPHIWNGEEIGMWGADDPDERKPLWWPDHQFEPETRTNIQPGDKLYDDVGFNAEHFEWYKKLIAIRKNNPVLNNGAIEFLTTAGGILIYRRYDNQDEILVYLNTEDHEYTFNLPDGQYLDLLTDQRINGPFTLSTLNGAILKRLV